MKRTNFFFPEEMLERLKAAKLHTGIPRQRDHSPGGRDLFEKHRPLM
ncbi:MAG: hypothetical protein I8H71_15160 [Xanthomonadaceae bacterium]|nr:hypothetical protein [Xanthomonadaceae bacterium]